MKKTPHFCVSGVFSRKMGHFFLLRGWQPCLLLICGNFFLKKTSVTHRASPVRPLPGAVDQGAHPFVDGGQAHWGEGQDNRRDIQGLKDKVDGTKIQTCQIANVQTF